MANFFASIIAIMLGRLRMSIKDCVQRYRWFAREFFEIPLQPLLTSCFKTQDRSHEWEVRLKELVNNHAGTDQDLGFKSPQDLCKTQVDHNLHDTNSTDMLIVA